MAREEALLAIEHIQTQGDDLQLIRRCIEGDIKEVHGALLDVQRLYHEIAASITTSIVARTVLNKQRHAIVNLHKEGLLDLNELQKLKGSVEYQMKKLAYHPPIIVMPNKLDILRQIEWLECIDRNDLPAIVSSFDDAIFQRGDILVGQGDRSDNVFVLARGTVVVSYTSDVSKEGEVHNVELGMGSIFGEIAWVLGRERGATIKATSPGLIFSIQGSKLREICSSNLDLENNLWETCGRRLSENALFAQGGQTRQQIRDIVNEMKLHSIDPINKRVHFYNRGRVMLLRGTALVDLGHGNSTLIDAPNLLPTNVIKSNTLFQVEFSTDAKFMCHKNSLERNPRPFDSDGVANNRITSEVAMELKSQFVLSRGNSQLSNIDGLDYFDSQRQQAYVPLKRRYTSSNLIVPSGTIDETRKRRSTISSTVPFV